jgi:ribonucleoside-diphosphate reductase alpha chain
MYYLRTQAATQAVQFTIEKQGSNEMEPVIPKPEEAAKDVPNIDEITTDFQAPSCSMEDGCISCSG